jgi:hypothetical protein
MPANYHQFIQTVLFLNQLAQLILHTIVTLHSHDVMAYF